MAQNFAGITTLPFAGVTFRLPVKLPQGVVVPPNQVPPSVCPINIVWNNYWQLAGQPDSVGVSINLQAASVQASILDRIASVKIDNTDSPNSIFVLFPDTGDCITAPPYTVVTMPVLTNGLLAIVYVEGLTAGTIPYTNIFFYNVIFPPSIDPQLNQTLQLQKASPVITRGTTIYNENYGTPALGDQLYTSPALLADGNTGAKQGVWGAPYASGFLYIQSVVINAASLYDGGTSALPELKVFNEIGDVFVDVVGAVNTTPVSQNFLNLTGMNIKLDATRFWTIEVIGTVTFGIWQMFSSYTQNSEPG